MMSKYSNEQKNRLLLKHDWTPEQGVCLDYSTEHENIFVSKTELESALEKGYVWYYFHKDCEWVRTLDEAWDDLLDELYEKNNFDSEDEFEIYLKTMVGDE